MYETTMYELLAEERLVKILLVFVFFLLLGLIVIILAYGYEEHSQSAGTTKDATDHSKGLS